MVYELRIYTCKPGAVERVLTLWEQEGKAMLDLYFKMAGQWTTISGITNRIYTLWEFTDLNHREEARKQLLLHPGFDAYLARCRDLYVEQEAIFLNPTTLSLMPGNR